MRIAHIESSMDWGGQELRIVEQTEWLNRNGHKAWIIARPGSAILHKAKEKELPIFAMNIRGSAHPATFRSLQSFLKKECVDLLDCHGNRDSTYGAYVKWLGGAAVVRSRHVTDPIRVDAFRRLIWRNGNHGVIVTAGKIRDMLVGASLARQELISVAVAGVDEGRFNPLRGGNILRQRLGIAPDEVVIANVGMIRPDKGQLYFVRACRELLSRHQNITCIQLGEATGQTEAYKQQVLAECGEALNNGRIRFLGYQSDIENWLAMADMVVVASIATEAQTRLVAQAFMMKKNVVATTTGGLPEMIDHQRTGLLCPSSNVEELSASIERLLTEPGLAESLREAAYQHAIQYMSFDYMMKGMLQAYQQAGRRAGRSFS